MKKTLVNFATAHYREAQQRLGITARPWFDDLRLLGEDALTVSFRQRHYEHLRYARGYGFWVWKPWLILQELDRAGPDDMVMWCDSQVMFIDDPAPLFPICKANGGVMFFNQDREGHKNRTWTRRDCFVEMGCDKAQYWDGSQVNSACSVWMKTPLAMALCTEWCHWCSNLRAVGDEVSVLSQELPGFKDHRHDQSILAIMAIRHNIRTFPDCSQYGNGYKERERGYPQILKIDRMVSACYPIPCRRESV